MAIQSNIKPLDPVQGLVDYVLDIKPYHTKIIEVLIEYVYGEKVETTVIDDYRIDVDLTFKRTVDRVVCENAGYDTRPYDASGRHLILSPNISKTFLDYPAIDVTTNTFIVLGDQTKLFTPNSTVYLTSYIIDTSVTYRIIDSKVSEPQNPSSPVDLNKKGSFSLEGDVTGAFPVGTLLEVVDSPNSGTYQVLQSTYDSVSNLTTLVVSQPVTVRSNGGFITQPRTIASNTGTFTVVESTYNPGFIDSWPDQSTASSFIPGNLPHTVVEVQQPLTDPLTEITNPATQHYISYALPDFVEIVNALSYSNTDRYYDPISPSLREFADEGYKYFDIVGVDLVSNAITVSGTLSASNIFPGDQLKIVNSSDNDGTYDILTITEDAVQSTTTLVLSQPLQSDTADGQSRFDIPANVLIVDGDHTNRFVQGTKIDVIGGTLSGTYTVLYSDFVNSQTRIRVLEGIFDHVPRYPIIDVTTAIVLAGDMTGEFTIGGTLTIVNSVHNDGRFDITSVAYDSVTNTTSITVQQPLVSEPGGEAVPTTYGVIKEHSVRGFSNDEAGNLCVDIPDTFVHVTVNEFLQFSSTTLDLYDDIVAYNLENTDKTIGSYDLPIGTITSTTAPPIPEQPSPPLSPGQDDLWFDTTTNELKQWDGGLWKRKITAWWFEPTVAALYYRTKTSIVDTGWVLDAMNIGYSSVVPSSGKLSFVNSQTFIAVDTGNFVPQTTFELTNITIPNIEILSIDAATNTLNVASDPTDYLTEGNTIQIVESTNGSNDGIYTVVGFTSTTITLKEPIVDPTANGFVIPRQDLVRITVDSVPATFSIYARNLITVSAPLPNIGSVIKVDVYDINNIETNAHVVSYDYMGPNTVVHNYVDIDDVNNGVVIYGGNFVQRLNSSLSLTLFNTNGQRLDNLTPIKSLPIQSINFDTNSVTVIGDYQWLFQPQRILYISTSPNNGNNYTIQSSTFNGTVTTIELVEPVLFQTTVPDSGVPVRHTDNVSNTFEVWGDQTSSYAPSDIILWDMNIEIANVRSSTIEVYGDYSGLFVSGVKLRTYQSSANNDEQTFVVSSSSYDSASNITTITLDPTTLPIDVNVAGGKLFTIWTVTASNYQPSVAPPNATLDDLGVTIISVAEDIPINRTVTTDKIRKLISQQIIEDYGVVLPAAYDPIISPGEMQPKTVVAVQQPLAPIVCLNCEYYASYKTLGPLTIDIGLYPTDQMIAAIVDSIGVDGEATTLPQSITIVNTSATNDWFAINYIDPLTTNSVNMEGYFLPGTIFNVTDAVQQGSSNISNNSKWVVDVSYFDNPRLTKLITASTSEVTFEEFYQSYSLYKNGSLLTQGIDYDVTQPNTVTLSTPLNPGDVLSQVPSGIDPTLANGSGNTYIFVQKDFSQIPPYTTFDVASVSNNDNTVREDQTGLVGNPTITFSTVTYKVGQNDLSVYLNGVKQLVNVDYTEVNSNSISWISSRALTTDDKLTFIAGSDQPNTIILNGDYYNVLRTTWGSDKVETQTGFTTDQINGIDPITLQQLSYTPGGEDLIVYKVSTTGERIRMQPLVDYIERSSTEIAWTTNTPLTATDTLEFYLAVPPRQMKLDQPLISTDPRFNVITILNVEVVAMQTYVTISETLIDETFTGPLGMIYADYSADILYDAANVPNPAEWSNGRIVKDVLDISTRDANAVAADITETFNISWGTTHQWPIVQTDSANGKVFVAGDVTTIINPIAGLPIENDTGVITGSQGNDGTYEITSVTYNIGTNQTEITLNPPIPTDPPAELLGTLLVEDIDVTDWFQYKIIAIDATLSTVTVYGDATGAVQQGQDFVVAHTANNDGRYTAALPPTFDGTNTTITTQQAPVASQDAGGWVESYRDYGARLFLEDTIAVSIAENADAVVLATGGPMTNAWDYRYFDIGTWDENVNQVIHLYSNTL